jgi:Sigma-70, region 4
VEIDQMSLRRLRRAIQENEISFPAQVPIFPKQSRADIQWRVVELYFVRNWSPRGIAQRYQITSERVRQVISQWVRRATALGYLEVIYR